MYICGDREISVLERNNFPSLNTVVYRKHFTISFPWNMSRQTKTPKQSVYIIESNIYICRERERDDLSNDCIGLVRNE